MNQKKYRFLWTLVIGVLFSIEKTPWVEAASEFQLQPITTTTLCTAALNDCAAAGLPNVCGAKLYRPTTDVLGTPMWGSRSRMIAPATSILWGVPTWPSEAIRCSARTDHLATRLSPISSLITGLSKWFLPLPQQ